MGRWIIFARLRDEKEKNFFAQICNLPDTELYGIYEYPTEVVAKSNMSMIKALKAYLRLSKLGIYSSITKSEQELSPAEKRIQTGKRTAIAILAIAVLFFFSLQIYHGFIVPNSKYITAMNFLKEGKYNQASIIFQSLDDFKDSDKRIIQIKANKKYDSGDYAAAYLIYKTLGPKYNQHENEYKKIYDEAEANLKNGNNAAAYEGFKSLGTYKDSETRVIQAEASKLFDAGKYSEAYIVYNTIDEKYNQHKNDFENIYKNALQLMEKGENEESYILFSDLGIYKDSENRAKQARANKLYADGDLASAYNIYASIDPMYNQHSEDYKNLYEKAEQLRDEESYEVAFDIFKALGTYGDSQKQLIAVGEILAEQYEAEKKFAKASEVYTKIGLNSKAKEATELQQKENKYQEALRLMENGQYSEADIIFVGLKTYEDSAELSKKCNYQIAYAYMDEQQYMKAADLFKELGDFQDSETMVNENMYLYAKVQEKEGTYKIAEDIYSYLGSYKDSSTLLTNVMYKRADAFVKNGKYNDAITIYKKLEDEEKIKQTTYLIAERQLKNGQVIEAIDSFKELGDYQDASERAESLNKEYIQNLKNDIVFAEGNTIIFGSYEQNGYQDDGKEPLEWIILRKTDHAIFVTTKYAIDCKRYDGKDYTVWENSNIRKWLNGSFYNNAFTEKEQGAIRLTAVSNTQKDGKFETDAGKNTNDKIYLLSYYEVTNYFKNDEERKLQPTQYAKEVGAHTPNCYWMTRSPGKNNQELLAVKNNGQPDHSTTVKDEHLGVRPAMWLDLDKEATIDASFAEWSTITFGKYGDETKDTYEPLRWIILENNGKSVKLLSEKAIDNLQYHPNKTTVSWSNSYLRKWLNSTFVDTAFDETEKGMMLTMDINYNSSDSIDGYRQMMKVTIKDRVTLPSYFQILKMDLLRKDIRIKPTAYAKQKGAGGTYTEYWLSSNGKDDHSMAIIKQNGDIDSKWVTDKKGIVPMIEIRIPTTITE